jgi:hypothetical protein
MSTGTKGDYEVGYGKPLPESWNSRYPHETAKSLMFVPIARDGNHRPVLSFCARGYTNLGVPVAVSVRGDRFGRVHLQKPATRLAPIRRHRSEPASHLDHPAVVLRQVPRDDGFVVRYAISQGANRRKRAGEILAPKNLPVRSGADATADRSQPRVENIRDPLPRSAVNPDQPRAARRAHPVFEGAAEIPAQVIARGSLSARS